MADNQKEQVVGGEYVLFYFIESEYCHCFVSTPCPTLVALSVPPPGQAVLSTHQAVLPAPQSVPVIVHAAAPTLCVLSHPPGPAYLVST